MKKLILMLFLCLSCFSFGSWIIEGERDEFGDLRGEELVSLEKENMHCFSLLHTFLFSIKKYFKKQLKNSVYILEGYFFIEYIKM